MSKYCVLFMPLGATPDDGYYTIRPMLYLVVDRRSKKVIKVCKTRRAANEFIRELEQAERREEEEQREKAEQAERHKKEEEQNRRRSDEYIEWDELAELVRELLEQAAEKRPEDELDQIELGIDHGDENDSPCP